MRPRQWIKNLLVFAAVFYGGKIGERESAFRAFAAFVLFCALSGVVYLVNDILDLEQDRLHPLKRLRPIASGRLSVNAAWSAAVLIAPTALLLSFALSRGFGQCAVAYFLLMFGYSFGLKRVVILDVLLLAIGFVLRAYAGAEAVEVATTKWFFECVLFLSLFVAICKRRHELVLLNNRAGEHRAVLKEYSSGFLDQMVAASTAGAILTYSLWAMDEETARKFGPHMIITVPFVVYGIFRYLYLVYHRSEGGAPEMMFLTDRPLLIGIFLWAIVAIILVYYRDLLAWVPVPGRV